VGTRFQVLFHSPPGVLFTIPSRYSSAIGHWDVFRLTGWSRPIHSRFHGPAATRDTPQAGAGFSRTGLSPSTADHPRPLPLTPHFLTARRGGSPSRDAPTTPHTQPLPGLSCARFSHPPRSLATTNGITQLFSSPAGTEMFHFPAFPPAPYTFRCG
jgi:hypothetical protein